VQGFVICEQSRGIFLFAVDASDPANMQYITKGSIGGCKANFLLQSTHGGSKKPLTDEGIATELMLQSKARVEL
jgi:hypothetical protein